MGHSVVSEFAQLCERRFASLGDAVRSVLTVLEQHLPAGRVIFAELNFDTDEYRVLDARGEPVAGLDSGVRIPLQDSFCLHMANDAAPALIGRISKDPVYGQLDLHKTGRVHSYVAAPVELGDGTRVASVCAISRNREHYGEDHHNLLTIAARLIAYEWECVNREAELRRLVQQQRALTGDPLTGLALRDAFLEKLDREWHLTQRGITESYVVAVKPVGIEDARATSGGAVADLLLQSTGAVIQADVRRSDIAGRVGDDLFGVILVGCKGIDGAEAFLTRLAGAFERKLSQRPEKLELTWGVQALGESNSAADALERAEEALGAEPVAQRATG